MKPFHVLRRISIMADEDIMGPMIMRYPPYILGLAIIRFTSGFNRWGSGNFTYGSQLGPLVLPHRTFVTCCNRAFMIIC